MEEDGLISGDDESSTPEEDDEDDNIDIELKRIHDQIRQILVKVGKFLGSPDQNGFSVSGPVPAALNTSIRLNNSGIELKFPLRIEEVEKISPNPRHHLNTNLSFWQLAVSDFTILNQKWEGFLSNSLLPLVLNELGVVSSPVTAILSKLVISAKPEPSEPAASFKKFKIDPASCHWADKDRNDARDNIGFLIVQLPSSYVGGEIQLKNGNSEINLAKMGGSEEFETFYTAFYSDADHAFLPVTEGVQTLLLYKLKLALDPETKSELSLCKSAAKSVSYQEKASALSASLKGWSLQVEAYYDKYAPGSIHDSVLVPEKLVYITTRTFLPVKDNGNLDPADQSLANLLQDLSHNQDLTVLFGRNDCDGSYFHVGNVSLVATMDPIIEKIFRENVQLKELPVFPCELVLEEEPVKETTSDEDDDEKKSALYGNGTFIIFTGHTFLKNLVARQPSHYVSIGETLLLCKYEKFKENMDQEQSPELRDDVVNYAKEFLGLLRSVYLHSTSSSRLNQLFTTLLDEGLRDTEDEVDLTTAFFSAYKEGTIRCKETLLPLMVKAGEEGKLTWEVISSQLLIMFGILDNPGRGLECLLATLKSHKDEQVCRKVASHVLTQIHASHQKRSKGGSYKEPRRQNVHSWHNRPTTPTLLSLEDAGPLTRLLSVVIQVDDTIWSLTSRFLLDFKESVLNNVQPVVAELAKGMNISKLGWNFVYGQVCQILNWENGTTPSKSMEALTTLVNTLSKDFLQIGSRMEDCRKFAGMIESQFVTSCRDVIPLGWKSDQFVLGFLLTSNQIGYNNSSLLDKLPPLSIISVFIHLANEAEGRLEEPWLSYTKEATFLSRTQNWLAQQLSSLPEWRERKDFRPCQRGPEASGCQHCTKVWKFMLSRRISTELQNLSDQQIQHVRSRLKPLKGLVSLISICPGNDNYNLEIDKKPVTVKQRAVEREYIKDTKSCNNVEDILEKFNRILANSGCAEIEPQKLGNLDVPASVVVKDELIIPDSEWDNN